MTQTPTTDAIDQLAHDIASDGLAPHHDTISHIVHIARQSGLNPGAVEVLSDTTASDVVRSRAFMAIARNWHEIAEATSRWATFRQAFDAFIAQWNRHQELRQCNDLDELWTSRTKLDVLRADMALHRTLSR